MNTSEPTPDQKRLMDMLEKIREVFKEWGFVVGVVQWEDNKIWAWSNLKDPLPVVKWLYENHQPTILRKIDVN